MSNPPSFDRIAGPYRWLEYLALGRTLELCRNHFLPRLLHSRRALVLGDGDGRFLARLLARNPNLHADAVDSSARMLHLLHHRALAANPAARLHTHHADVLTFHPAGTYDLIVTHFFLDCLTQPELNRLALRLAPCLAPPPDARLAAHLAPQLAQQLAQQLSPRLTPQPSAQPVPVALWLVSDFRIPPGLVHHPARILVRLLYLAFRLLTGLTTSRLPDHASALRRAGLFPIAIHHSLLGILTTEIWQRHPSASSHHPTPIDRTLALQKEALMTTPSPVSPFDPPSPVPDIPVPPGTDLPSGPISDPLPDPEPASPSL